MQENTDHAMILPRKVDGAEPLDLQALATYWPGDANFMAPWVPAKARGLAGLKASRPVSALAVAVLMCPTTMDLAREMAPDILADPFDAVVSVVQSAGTGQAGKSWESIPGNLHVSFILPEPPPGWAGLASMVLGLGVLKGLESLGCPDLILKWPNDVLQGGNKICGLLVRERASLAVAGLGLNLFMAPERGEPLDMPAARLEFGPFGPPPGPLSLWAALVEFLQNWYASLFKEYDPEEFIRLAEARLAWVGREIAYSGDDSDAGGRGRVIGLAPDGGLAVSTDRGETILYSASIRPAS